MGLQDVVTKNFTRNKKVFADVFNFAVYGGKQVIDPSALSDSDSTELALPYANGDKPVVIQKYRDVFKVLTAMEDSKAIYALLGLENQSEINYAMPPKDMLYDALSYAKQITDIARLHREAGDKATSGEFLSGLHKGDKLKPVITLVVYWGADEWDAPTSLHSMLDVQDEALLRFVPDYKITVISPYALSLEELDKFHSEIREVLKYIKYSTSMDDMERYITADDSYKSVSREAIDVINAMTNSDFKVENGKENVDMCKALEDMKEKYEAEGKAEGRAEAQKDLAEKMRESGYSEEEIKKLLA